MTMTAREYFSSKPSKQWKDLVNLRKQVLLRQMTQDDVPRSEVGADLRQAFGIVGGTATEDQQKAMDNLLRLSSWNGCESPPEGGGLADFVKPASWSITVNLIRHMGQNPPKLGVLAKSHARSIVRDNLSPAFVESYGGIEDYAVGHVIERLFPDSETITIKPSKDAYLSRSLSQLMQLCGIEMDPEEDE